MNAAHFFRVYQSLVEGEQNKIYASAGVGANGSIRLSDSVKYCLQTVALRDCRLQPETACRYWVSIITKLGVSVDNHHGSR